jgi:hypothetical protein
MGGVRRSYAALAGSVATGGYGGPADTVTSTALRSGLRGWLSEAERHRIERPCPRHQPKITRHLLADVIRDYLGEAKVSKRSYRDDARYGHSWTERLGGRSLEEITPAELERIRAERLAGNERPDEWERGRSVKPATVNREFAFLKHLYNVAIRDGKTDKTLWPG